MRFRLLHLVCLSVLLALPVAGAAACPNPDLNATVQLRTNGASLRMGQMRRATAGGPHQLDGCPALGLGEVPEMFFSDAPSMSADLGGMMGLAMEISAEGACATGLLIRTADGNWYYDDSGRGPGLPRIMLRSPGRGMMRFWVGTPDGAACRATIRLATYAG